MKKAAQAFHEHPQERGISKLIAIDAELSPQYVSDWKAGRSPIPMSTLAKLATLYGVSSGYLAGFTEDPAPKVTRNDAVLGAKMAELVERAIEKSSEPVDTKMATKLCQIAIQMLSGGEKDATILGTLINIADGRSEELNF
ncbi:helix-turn-helix transcriptional regulator [Halomonas aquamarina]|uniref:helix-turn-helix domain-containing protein n=1 Tax=Vreelandella aquamarina TaxID=77097 RepID=UPI00235A45CF|nr:helix-turn-helix transcriptional regulator [Halomonas aquamarina]MDC8443736.1 helix-turn-helix transcriptional regulator [Halomonas aquamarina]